MSSAYGRAIAYTAVFEGTSFASIAGSEVFVEEEKGRINMADRLGVKKYPIPPATMMFVNPEQLAWLATRVKEEAMGSWMFDIGWRHKLGGVEDGFVSNQTLWDRLVFDGARAKVMGEDVGVLRAVVVSGGECLKWCLTIGKADMYMNRTTWS
jgi:long-chain acyl-CoA synthetase